MKAIVYPRHGGSDVVECRQEFPDIEPAPGEALVRVRATGVNRVDLVSREGYPGIGIAFPHIPGGDIAGEVVSFGNNGAADDAAKAGISTGTRVVAYPLIACGGCELCAAGRPNLCLNWKFIGLHTDGGYAEYARVPVENLIPLPDSVSFEAAAALPVAGLTAFHAIKTVGNLQPGETFFIWGGGGGLGTFAVKLAKSIDTKVIATAGAAWKLDEIRKLGADFVLDRTKVDVAAEVKRIAPNGVDFVVNYVGSDAFPASFEMLKRGGRMVLCGMLTGRESPLSLHMTYLRHLSIHGVYLGTKAEMTELVSMLASNQISPHIGATLPLSDARKAQELMAQGEVVGKIVLVP
ncbi:MAG: zinc-binding dehydrogenase [bacterium]|jgi:NADPH:quinone reductase-like Zn-dependent oxidoreductase